MRPTTFLLPAVCAIGLAQEAAPPAKPAPQPSEFEVPAAAWEGVEREAATLGWSPRVGQVTSYRATTTVQLLQDYGHEAGEQDPVEIRSTQAYRLEVLEVGEARVRVRCTARELVLALSASGMTLLTDSRDGTRSGNPGLDLFADLVDEPFVLELIREGQVSQIVDLSDLHARLKAKSSFERVDVAELVDGERLARELQPFFAELRPGEFASGARWALRRSLQAAPGQIFDGVQTWVYLGIAEFGGVKCAKLVGQFSLAPQELSEPGPNGVRRIAAEGRPYVAYVSLEDGAVLGSEPQSMTVTTEQSLAGVEGTLTLTSETTVTALPAEAPAAPPGEGEDR